MNIIHFELLTVGEDYTGHIDVTGEKDLSLMLRALTKKTTEEAAVHFMDALEPKPYYTVTFNRTLNQVIRSERERWSGIFDGL